MNEKCRINSNKCLNHKIYVIQQVAVKKINRKYFNIYVKYTHNLAVFVLLALSKFVSWNKNASYPTLGHFWLAKFYPTILVGKQDDNKLWIFS